MPKCGEVRDSYYRTNEAQVSTLDHVDCRKCHLTHKIDHVGGEKGGAVLLEEGLVGIEHAVEPWKKLLGAWGIVSTNRRELCTRHEPLVQALGMND